MDWVTLPNMGSDGVTLSSISFPLHCPLMSVYHFTSWLTNNRLAAHCSLYNMYCPLLPTMQYVLPTAAYHTICTTHCCQPYNMYCPLLPTRIAISRSALRFTTFFSTSSAKASLAWRKMVRSEMGALLGRNGGRGCGWHGVRDGMDDS